MGLGGLPAVEENINSNRVCAAKSNAAAAADIPSVIPPSPSPLPTHRGKNKKVIL